MSAFIHNFIKSMTMREKAYFKRFANLHNENKNKNYLQLYDALEKMEHFNKGTLLKDFKGRPIAKHLSSELDYLLKQILKSLANFYFEKNTPMKLQQSILYIEILIRRSFPKKAQKYLNKTKKIAQGYEDFTTILKLIQLEEEILFRQGILGFGEDLKSLEQERELITVKINNLNWLRVLREQIREWQLPGNEKSRVDISTFFDHVLIKNESNVLSVRAKEHWYYNLAVLHSYIKENNKALKIYEEGIDFLKQHRFIFKPAKVLVFMSNYLLACCELKDKASFFKMYNQLIAYESNNDPQTIYVGFIKYARLLELYYQIKDNKAAVQAIPELAEFLQKHSEGLEILQKSYLYMILTRACIQTGKYELALEFLNTIIQKGIRAPLIPRSRLFLLMVYIQLDWLELAQSEIESTYKLLVRHKMQNGLTKAFLKYWKAYIRYPKRRIHNTEKLVIQLEQLSTVPELKNEFDFFDYVAWVNKELHK